MQFVFKSAYFSRKQNLHFKIYSNLLKSLEEIRKNNTHSYININLLQIFTTRLQTYLRKKTVIRTDGSIAMNERYYINFE